MNFPWSARERLGNYLQFPGFSMSERLGTRLEKERNLKHRIYKAQFEDRICTSQFSAQNRNCRQKFEVCKSNDKKKALRI